VDDELSRLAARVEALEELTARLAQGQQDHDAWLTSLSQRRTAERLTSGDYLVHHQISQSYRDLIGQRLLDAAVMAGADGELGEAAARASLARALFDAEMVGRGAEDALAGLGDLPVPADGFWQLWESAAQIRGDALASGHAHRWVFDFEPGAAMDPSWQEPLEGCEPADPVLLVVAPAYLVEDKYYVKQLVYTQPSPPEPEPGQPGPAEPAPAEAEQPPADPLARPRRPRWWRRLRRPAASTADATPPVSPAGEPGQ